MLDIEQELLVDLLQLFTITLIFVFVSESVSLNLSVSEFQFVQSCSYEPDACH